MKKLTAALFLSACTPAYAANYDLDIFDVWGEELLNGTLVVEPVNVGDPNLMGLAPTPSYCIDPDALKEHIEQTLTPLGVVLVGEPEPTISSTGEPVILVVFANDPDLGYAEGWSLSLERPVTCLFIVLQPAAF